MSDVFNSGDLSNIEGVDNQIQDFIAQIEQGHAPNPTKLLQIEESLKSLVKNDKIPDVVKQSLQGALQQLSSDTLPGGATGIAGLYGAKLQIDEALETGKGHYQQQKDKL